MPTPLGHTIAGLTAHLASARDRGETVSPGRVVLFAAVACAPDIDLLFGLVDGRNHHSGWTHSIGAAVIAGALAFVATRGRNRPLAFGIGLAWASHTLLDWLNRDTNPPIGIMALWPFDAGYYNIPWPILLDIPRRFEWECIRHNLIAATWEAVLLTPLLVWLARRRFGSWRGWLAALAGRLPGRV